MEQLVLVLTIALLVWVAAGLGHDRPSLGRPASGPADGRQTPGSGAARR